MSIEIDGFNEADRAVTGHIAHLASQLCAAQGINHAESYATGNRGATYALEVVMTALRQMNVITDDFEHKKLVNVAQQIADHSVDPRPHS